MTQPAKSYCRVMLGRQSAHAAECLASGFIGADFGIEQDLTGELPDEWRQFNAVFIPVFLAGRPGRNRSPNLTRPWKAPLSRWTMTRSSVGHC